MGHDTRDKISKLVIVLACASPRCELPTLPGLNEPDGLAADLAATMMSFYSNPLNRICARLDDHELGDRPALPMDWDGC